MAVVVVDPKPHQSVIKAAVCRHCGVTLNYTPNDVKKHVHYSYDGSSDSVKYINCPSCGLDLNL